MEESNFYVGPKGLKNSVHIFMTNEVERNEFVTEVNQIGGRFGVYTDHTGGKSCIFR